MRKPDIDAVRTLDPNAVFSVGEVGRMLGMTHNGVLSRIKTGNIRAGKSGARYFIAGAEVQRQITLPDDVMLAAQQPKGPDAPLDL